MRLYLLIQIVVIGLGFGLAEWQCRDFVVKLYAEALRTKEVYVSPLTDAVFGDSEMFHAFEKYSGLYQNRPRDKEFEGMAISGETTSVNEVLVKEYFRFRKPGRVILQAGGEFFAQNRNNRGVANYDTFFTQNNALQHFIGIRSYFIEQGIGGYLIPALRRRFPFNLTPVAVTAPMDECFRTPWPANWSLFSARCRKVLSAARFHLQRPILNFKKSESFAAYRRTIQYLIDKGARLCLVTLPISPDLRKLEEADQQYRRADKAIIELAAELGVRYVDFRPMTEDLLPAEFFHDTDHMTPAASKRFAPKALRACF